MLVGLPGGRSQHSMNLMVPINSLCCSVQRGRVLLQKCQVDPPWEKYLFLYATPEAVAGMLVLSRQRNLGRKYWFQPLHAV